MPYGHLISQEFIFVIFLAKNREMKFPRNFLFCHIRENKFLEIMILRNFPKILREYAKNRINSTKFGLFYGQIREIIFFSQIRENKFPRN